MTGKEKGFTYIEMLITVVLMSICFVPIMTLFRTAVIGAASTQELVVGLNLARQEMEKVRNLNYTEERLREIGEVTYPAPGEEPLRLSGMDWRITRKIKKDSDPLELSVIVYKIDRGKEETIAELVTLLEDFS